MTPKDHDIHQAVRQRYGSLARRTGDPDLPITSASPCCSEETTDCCGSSELYSAEMLEALPTDVTDLSLGCGDPVTIAELHEGETVLDLGSGGGIDCFLAARQVGPEGYVIGVDMTPEMIARANANKAKLGMTNVEFRQGQIEALPIADEQIDVIMSNCVINLSPDKAAVFREAFRVLKPGGRVAVSDIVTQGDFSPEMRANADQWAACITGAVDVGQYIALMQAAGFVDITVVDKSSAETIIGPQPQQGPQLFSARITGRKPG